MNRTRRHRQKTWHLLGTAALAGAALGTGGWGGTAQAAGLPASSLSGEWRLVAPERLTAGADLIGTPTLTFSPRGELSGMSGCNRFSGRYAARADVLAVGPLASTRMGCDPAAMTRERDVLNALSGPHRVRLEADTLEIGGRQPLTFRRVTPSLNLPASDAQTLPAQTLPAQTIPAQTSPAVRPQEQPPMTYRVTSLTVQGQALTLPDFGTVTLQPADGGMRFSAQVGCNTLNGMARPVTGSAATGAAAQQWSFGPVASTRMGCPPAEAAAEAGLARLLSAPAAVERRGGQLTLRSALGELVLQDVAGHAGAGAEAGVALRDLTGEWQVTQLRHGEDRLTLAAPGRLSLHSGDDGRLQLGASVGCNNLFGTLELQGGAWVGTPASTLMMCSPEDMRAEAALAAVLSAPLTFTADGDGGLTLRSDQGEMRLSRAASAPAPDAAPQGRYTLTSLRVAGRPVDPARYSQAPYLEFIPAQGTQAARLAGSDGCNLLSGEYRWQADGAGLSLGGPLAGTLRACPDLPDDLPNLGAALGASFRTTLQGDRLTLTAGDQEWVFQR